MCAGRFPGTVLELLGGRQGDRTMPDLFEKSLCGIMATMGMLLHPTIIQQSLRRIGAKIGRDVASEYQRTHTVGRPFSREDFVRCIEHLGESWGCGYRKVEEETDRIEFCVGTCPLADAATQYPDICELENGIFGGIAGDELGFAKVCVNRSNGASPKYCRILVHITQTKRNLAAEGSVYPEDSPARYDLREGRTSGAPLRALSAREREVLRCIGEGLSDKEIADALHVSARTAEGHAARIREKLEVRKRADLIRYALRHQLSGI